MAFPLNIYLLSLAAAFLASLATMPLWRRFCLRSGLVDEPGHRKIHSAPIPLAGGLAVFSGMAFPLIAGGLAVWWSNHAASAAFLGPNSANWMEYGISRRGLQLAGILGGALGMLAIGWLDDRHELKPLPKFAGQLLIAVAVAACGVRITLFVPSVVFSYIITVLWLLTLVNAFNFMDNMNGLCAGVGAIGCWVLGVLAAAQGHYLVATLALTGFGALAGFLPYNFPNARAFLGDAGSHLVGFLLAVLAILPHFHSPTAPNPWAVLIPLLVVGVPLIDLVWVLVIRWRLGQPFYVGDNNHLSHRLVRRGFSKRMAVLMLWLLAAVLGALGALVQG